MTEIENYLKEKVESVGVVYTGNLKVNKGEYLFEIRLEPIIQEIDFENSIFTVNKIYYHFDYKYTYVQLKADHRFINFCVKNIKLEEQNL